MPESWSTLINGLSLAFYVAALALSFLHGGLRRTRIAPWIIGCLAAGFLGHTVEVTTSWASSGTIPATTLRELCGAQAWILVFLYLILFVRLRNTILAFFLTPIVTVSYLLYMLLPVTHLEPKAYFYTPWFVFHILTLLFGMSLFLLSFLYAMIYIVQDNRLRRQLPPPRLPLPPVERASRWASRLLLWGYPLFTVGILSSIVYGVRYGTGRDWHPGLMEGASILAWLVLGLAVWGWFSAKVGPRKRSWLIVAGACFTVLILIGILWH